MIEVYAARRKRLLEAMSAHPVAQAAGAPIAVFFAWPEQTRNGDVEHGYRPDSDISYLTGFPEPAAALVLAPGRPEGESLLYVREKDPKMETWTGLRSGVDATPARYGVDEARSISKFAAELPGLLRGRGLIMARLGRDTDRKLHAANRVAASRCRRTGVHPSAFLDVGEVLDPQRLIKDSHEIAALDAAAAASIAGHKRAMAMTRDGVPERTLEAGLRFEFAAGGAARVGYEPIVAGGANALILHYVENSRSLRAGDLVLVDAGAEVDLYTADITRTWPVSGGFSREQRRVYDIVLAAQRAAIDAAKPGASLRALDEIARRTLAEGLVELGWLEGDIETLVTKVPDPEKPEGTAGTAPLDKYYMHGTGHWLGSDVHDVGGYHDGDEPTPFAPGMVFTVEPGLYVPLDDDAAPEAYRGIGVRIEDNILITDDGNRNLTAALPTAADEVEALVGAD
jgi:Xaa-Pro aminopeptidase